MDATRVVVSNGVQQSSGPAGLRRAFATVGAVAPGVASWAAERLWFTPPRPPVSKEARAALARGTPLKITVDGRHVAAWSFGTGKAVALMHGWGGHAGQLVPMIEPLVKAGFRVVTFDALARIGLSWDELDVTGPHTPRVPALVIHDRDDREVPFADGEAVAHAWPNVTLHQVTGLGHRRLLKDPDVIARTAAFLQG